ncbi:Uncharacterised protein [Bordetella pertussis]|nr:Uncharacterised protein [Bordetella pertussis]CFW29769.1 Uncharacterised protein [Bordetella pertussis]
MAIRPISTAMAARPAVCRCRHVMRPNAGRRM